MKLTQRILAILAAGLFATANAGADTTSFIEAFDNATVQPGGPRSGTSGKNFLNVEGDNNGNFASYAAIDFNLGAFGIVEDINSLISISLVFTQSNAGFTLSGPLRFFITPDIGVNIQPGATTTYVAGDNYGLGTTSFATLHELGTDMFTATATGDTNSYTFQLSGLAPAAMDYLINTINTDGTLRLLVAPDDPSTAATWAGFSHNSLLGPQVSFEYAAVPEPGVISLVLAGGAAALMLGIVRQRRDNKNISEF